MCHIGMFFMSNNLLRHEMFYVAPYLMSEYLLHQNIYNVKLFLISNIKYQTVHCIRMFLTLFFISNISSY